MSDLLRVIYNKHDLFLIHVDVKAPARLTDALKDFARENDDNIIIVPSRPYSWAGWSQVETVLDALEYALSRLHWTHFITLSEQHLPAMSASSIRNLFATQPYSSVPARPVVEMALDEKSDIVNRFGVRYRELAGVGSFYNGVQAIDAEFINQLYHGSNWYALCRMHCEEIRALRSCRYFETYSHAVHQDENALQTAIWHTLRLNNPDSVRSQDTTFVAWPHITDNPHMIMCDSNLSSAIANNLPFVRKRADELTVFVRKHLDSLVDGKPIVLAPELSPKSDVETAPRTILRKRILNLAKRLEVNDCSSIAPSPSFHMQVKVADSIAVHVISSNLMNYKIAIVHNRPFEGFRMASNDKGFELSLIRVRAHNMFFHEEVVPTGDVERGFVDVSGEKDNGDKLMDVLRDRIDHAKRFLAET